MSALGPTPVQAGPGSAALPAASLVPRLGSLAARIEASGPGRATWITLALALAAIFIAVLWAALSEMDIVVSARGKLVPVESNLTVQPLETSVLRSIEVRAGQTVREGDVLARLDPTFAAADAGQLAARVTALQAEVLRLEIELGMAPASAVRQLGAAADQRRLLAERQSSLQSKARQYEQSIARLNASLATNRSEQAMLAERLAALRDLEKMNESLEGQQFVSRAKVLEAREKRLDAEREAQTAVLREREIRNQIAAAQEEMDSFMSTWRSQAAEALSKARRDLDEARQTQAKTTRREELAVLRAPADGVVLEVSPLSVGSVAREAEPVVTLVRSGSALEVEVEVAPADIGFLAVGQPVRIKLDAFPFQKHGIVQGRVASIARDSIAAPDAPQRGLRVVPVRVAIESDRDLRRPADAAGLGPGMSLTAEVVTGSRSVLSYLTYPIIRVQDEGLRER